jgi:uncharacterized membrane protein
MHYFLPIFRFFDDSWIGNLIADSNWLFPAIEAVHIVALALLLGAILVLNLRLLGLKLTSKPVGQLARELSPWVFCSLVIILATGVLLFASEAMKSYASVPFQIKMVMLFTAIVFHYTIYGRLTRADEAKSAWAKLAAVISIVLWTGVGAAGRAIGFL